MKRFVIVVLTAIIALGMLSACGGKSDKTRVLDRINEFFVAYKENDTYKTIRCFTGGEQYVDETYEDVTDLMKQVDCNLYVYGEIERVEVKSVGFPNIKEAFVTLNLYFKNMEEAVPWYMEMKKEGAEWYIYTMYDYDAWIERKNR